MARDESRVGERSGGVGYITLDAENGTFKFQDGTTASSIAVYLDRIDMEFKESIQRIPDRWHINLIVSTKLKSDTTMRQYQVQLSSHWKSPIIPNLMNAIAGAMNTSEWEDPENRFMILWTAKKPRQGKDDLPTALAFRSETRGDFLPNKYTWNEAGRFYEGGVPSDLAEVDKFWLSVAHALVKATGGNIVGADRATIPLGAPANLGLSLSETPAPPAEKSIVDRAKGYIEVAIAGGKTFIDAVTAAFNGAKLNGATENDLRLIAGWCTALGVQSKAIPYGFITINGEWDQSKAPEGGVRTDVTANHDPLGDGLPF